MKKLLLILMISTVGAPLLAFADTPSNGPYDAPSAFCSGGSCTYVPLEPLPGLPSRYGPNQGSFPGLIASVFKILLGAGATLAVVMLVIGALTYMFSDVVGSKTKALTRVRGAMWAIVLLVSSFLILNTINPDLVSFKLSLGTPGSAQNNINPAVTPATQQTPAQIQTQQNACQQQCTPGGGSVHQNPDGSFTCQCNPVVGSSPI